MNTIQKYLQIVQDKGLRYTMFRSKYELMRKSGLLARRFPTELKAVAIPSLETWRREGRYFFKDKSHVTVPKVRSAELREAMQYILQGDVLFFSKTWQHLGLDDDWVTNPDTGYHYDITQHWTKVNDFDSEAGDIKFVWERSRFSWLYTVIRYDHHFDEDHSEFVIGQILDWIDKNPLNCGPNYKCSQEISVRLNNWLFALNFYKESAALTEERWRRIMTSIFWQTEHVYRNIDFSRIAVRNNHAITETLTLYLMGLMFPQMPHAAKWKRKGKRWFDQEIAYQIEEDGTFIQDSMNYHRVVIQLLTYAIAIADAHGERYNDVVYEKACRSVNFLYQCQDTVTGWLPNYGNNDGALFFPLSDADYRDYRPQLDALHGLLTGQPLYGQHLEDALWVGRSVPNRRKTFPKLTQQTGIVRFDNSGYYLIREADTLTFMRCGLFKGKGTTDQLHVDVWHRGKNVLMDGGSYKYNDPDEALLRYFRGTESHNTVMLGTDDQMLKGARFLWFYPPRPIQVVARETATEYVVEGVVNVFRHVDKNIVVRRTLTKKKSEPRWTVEDYVENKPAAMLMRQLWHTDADAEAVRLESDGQKARCLRWHSDYYGVKEHCLQTEFLTMNNKINTTITIL